MSLSSTLNQWLERPECQEQFSALQSASRLPQMVYAALQLGLMLARWLLESELSARASPEPPGPKGGPCARRVVIGFNPRVGILARCRRWWAQFSESVGWVAVLTGAEGGYRCP